MGKVFYPELKEDYREVMAKMNRLIPPEAKITATRRPATHMFFRNLSFSTVPGKLGDYVIFDLFNPRENELNQNVALRDTLLNSKEFFPVAVEKKPNSLLMLFSRDPKAKKLPYPRLFAENEVKWNEQKLALPVNDPNFELRLRLIKSAACPRVDFFIRLNRNIDYDAKFMISLSDGTCNRYWSFFAGNGLLPTWAWMKGQIYCFSSRVPANFIPRKGYCKMRQLKTGSF